MKSDAIYYGKTLIIPLFSISIIDATETLTSIAVGLATLIHIYYRIKSSKAKEAREVKESEEVDAFVLSELKNYKLESELLREQVKQYESTKIQSQSIKG